MNGSLNCYFDKFQRIFKQQFSACVRLKKAVIYKTISKSRVFYMQQQYLIQEMVFAFHR